MAHRFLFGEAMKKCKKNKPCDSAKKIHVGMADERSGLFISNTVNLKTGERGVRVGYRFPKHQGPELKGYIWLNYCPWCGVDQSFPKKKKKRTK